MTELRATILVVEDEPEIRRFLRTSLGAEGYRVVEAESGARGAIDASTHKPDLAIVDLGLPDMDGVEVIRRIRAWSPMPIIVLSARAREQAIVVRVIEYALPGLADAQPRYRLLTTMLDPVQVPALELAALYHQRWQVEEVFDELKTHLLRSRRVLRSKTAELVRQEFYGWVLAHYAVRWLLHQGATRHRMPHDELSFASHVQLLRREQAPSGAFPPSQAEVAPTPLQAGARRKRPLASQPDTRPS